MALTDEEVMAIHQGEIDRLMNDRSWLEAERSRLAEARKRGGAARNSDDASTTTRGQRQRNSKK